MRHIVRENYRRDTTDRIEYEHLKSRGVRSFLLGTRHLRLRGLSLLVLLAITVRLTLARSLVLGAILGILAGVLSRLLDLILALVLALQVNGVILDGNVLLLERL